VREVLVDLRDRFLETGSLLAPSESAPAASQQVVVLEAPVPQAPVPSVPAPQAPLPSVPTVPAPVPSTSAGQAPAADEAKVDTTTLGSSIEKEGQDKKIEGEVAEHEARKEKTEQSILASEEMKGKYPEVALEEVIQARMPEPVASSNIRSKRDNIHGHEINLISISGLVNWAEESVKKLGLQKTEAILDVAEMMGLLTPQLKQIMTKLINVDSNDSSQSVSARAFLDSLLKVTTLLGKDNQTEAALLSILSREEDNG